MRLTSRTAFLLMLPCALLMLVAYIGPFGFLLVDSFTTKDGSFSLQNYSAIFSDSYYADVIIYTFQMSAWVTLFTFIIGYPLAYVISFRITNKLARRVMYIVIITPLFTANIVRSFGWMIILGRRGIVNETLLWSGVVERPLLLMFNEFGVVVGMVYIMLPFMVLTTTSVLQNYDRRLTEASKDLGAGPLSTFGRVLFPLSLPGVIAGSLIVFTLSVSAYVTPSVLSGGKLIVMSSVIFQQYGANLNYNFGAALSVVLLAATVGLIGLYLLLVSRSRLGRWSVT
jgi:putative spermidine/putrescine transport system permease protein